jgi:hypothetical protein
MRQEIRDILNGDAGFEDARRVIPEMPRGETIALANNSCAHCKGSGQKLTAGEYKTCDCVHRAIFRECLKYYRDIEEGTVRRSVTLSRYNDGETASCSWGHKGREYMADFYLVSVRHLDLKDQAVFKAHFIEGGDWRECCDVLNIERGNFFHAVYRIEQKLGRVFRELQPYALYPLSDYFSGTVEPGAIFQRVMNSGKAGKGETKN